MSNEKKFEAFKKRAIQENEERYGREVRQRWGNAVADAANEKALGKTQQEWADAEELGNAILRQLKVAMDEGDPSSDQARTLVAMHREWLCMYWPDGMYSPEAHKGLADGYVADQRFTAYYDEVAPGATQFLRDAVFACVG